MDPFPTDQPRPSRACAAVLPSIDGPRACTERAQPGLPYCSDHIGPAQPMSAEDLHSFLMEWRDAAARALRNAAERGDRDDHDPDLVRALLPLSLPLYSLYWRAETHGVHNIPTDGSGLLVANHSGTIPLDGAMLKVAVLKEHGRNPWLLAADLAFTIPGFRRLLRLAGNARADRDETHSLLERGELLGVFPEGFKGIGKGWQRRYQLQRFGRGGFIEVCMRTGAPIIPTAIIGAEETYPMIGNISFLARRFGLPYFPITPTWPLLGPLGAIPLPSKWIIAFGEPIPMVQHGPEAAEDTQLVLELTEEVRQRVQALIAEHLPRRRGTFF